MNTDELRKGFGTRAGRPEQVRAYHSALVAAANEIDRLRKAILDTIDENRHLADGDDCTLRHLVRAMVPTPP